MTDRVDVLVVGSGIVGLATARAVLRTRPHARVAVLDKEDAVAAHQTGRNSGVIHAGVYYPPGSAKAQLCVTGRRMMVELCREHGIAHRISGKLVVATEAHEEPALAHLAERSARNGVRVRPVPGEQLRDIEPHVAGRRGLHVLDTGVVDYAAVATVLADGIVGAGGALHLGTAVQRGHDRPEGLVVETTRGDFVAGTVVTCAGLHADRVARAISGPAGAEGLRIIPFRGEYHELVPERSDLVRGLIYPVPDPRFPFLGVHLTRGIDDHVHVGPNAVLALAREGYRWRDVSLRDVGGAMAHRGMRQLARAQWRYGLSEVTRSLSVSRLVRAVQRLVPDIVTADLRPAASGVRAQAVAVDGSLVQDFAFRRVGRALHVLNAPSPAATASLAIGEHIVDQLDLD